MDAIAITDIIKEGETIDSKRIVKLRCTQKEYFRYESTPFKNYNNISILFQKC